MKNIIKYLVLGCIAIQLTSCNDELDIDPFTEGDPDTFFNSIATFQNGVDGVYSQLFNYYSAGAGMQGMGDILSDNVIIAASGRRSNQVFYDFEYSSNNGGPITLYWSEAYEAINAANLVIGQIENIPQTDDRDNILGQALGARAFAHFDLVRTFAQIPTQSSEALSSPGVVYLKVEDGDTGDPFAEPSRETVQSNYDEIVGDLLAARNLIADDNGEGRLNTNAINAILSRVYLYLGEWQNAIDSANLVTTNIASMAELAGVYTDVTNQGLVFELAVNTTSEANFNNVGVIYSQSTLNDATGDISNTISEYVIDFDFFNQIQTNDIRRDIAVFAGANGNVPHNAVRKFLGETGQVNGLLDIKVIRAAEVLLNKAEAQFNLNDEAGALETLDILRSERLTTFPGGESGSDLEDAINFNRRVELVFEGHRFFDLKRRGESIQRSLFGDVSDGSGTPPDTQLVPAGNFRFQLPLPQAEINANINIEQNPGY